MLRLMANVHTVPDESATEEFGKYIGQRTGFVVFVCFGEPMCEQGNNLWSTFRRMCLNLSIT